MQFVEFLEAFGRIAEKISLVPYHSNLNTKETYLKRY